MAHKDKQRIGALLKYTRQHLNLKQQAFILDKHGVPICSLRTYIKIENGEEVKNDDFYELLLKRWHLKYVTHPAAEKAMTACFLLSEDLCIYEESTAKTQMQAHLCELMCYEDQNDYYRLFHRLMAFLLAKDGSNLEALRDAFSLVSLFGRDDYTPFYFALNEINVVSQLDTDLTYHLTTYLRQNQNDSLSNRFIQLILDHYEGKHYGVMQRIGDLTEDLFCAGHRHAWLTCLQLQLLLLWRIDPAYAKTQLLPRLQAVDEDSLALDDRIAYLGCLAPLLWSSQKTQSAYEVLLTLRDLSPHQFFGFFPLYMHCKENLGLPIEKNDFNLDTQSGDSSYYLAYHYYQMKYAGQSSQSLLKYLYQDVFASLEKGTLDFCIWRILWDEMARLCQQTESYKYLYLCYRKYAHFFATDG